MQSEADAPIIPSLNTCIKIISRAIFTKITVPEAIAASTGSLSDRTDADNMWYIINAGAEYITTVR